MGEDGSTQPRASWRRRAVIALAIFGALLLLFHRPVLLKLGHVLVVHFAKKENLKLEFRLEGSLFTNLTLRNLHATSTGPSAVESVDVDLARVDYGLVALLRGHISDALKNVQLRSARIVLNPANAPPPPKKQSKLELPDIFPKQLHVSDLTLIVRDHPHDLAVEHVDLDLNPDSAGALKIDKLQLPTGQRWANLAGPTTYSNRNFFLRDVDLTNGERLRVFNLDASQIDAKKLALHLEYVVGNGGVDLHANVREAQSTLDASMQLRGHDISLESLGKYGVDARGELEKVDVDLGGLLASPRTWNGRISAALNNFRQDATAIDQANFEIIAQNGKAILQTGDITQGENEIHLRGSTQLPRDLGEFGRGPATVELTARAPDLRGLNTKLSGSAQLDGKIDIVDAQLNGAFTLDGTSLGWNDGAVEKLGATVTVSKKMPAPNSKEPWFANLKSETKFTLDHARLGDFGFDSGELTVHSANDLVTLERSFVRQKENQFVVSGQYRLPPNLKNIEKQPATIDLSLSAPQLADYWVRDAADKLFGPLQMSGQVEWRDGKANGQLSIFGENLRMRELVFEFLNGQLTIANSVVYLNDLTARLNAHDFMSANGIVDLRPPNKYSGKAAVNIDNLSVFEPILRAMGNESELGGSLLVDWQGSGEAKTFKNSGTLRLILDNGRFGDARALQANVQADYSPEELDVPIIYIGSDSMNFQAVAETEGNQLEISKVELQQGQERFASGYVSVPFIWRNLGTGEPLTPANGKVTINFDSDELDLKKLFEDFGMKAPVSGLLNVKVDVGGTLAQLDGRADVQLRDVRSTTLEKLEPANVDLTAVVQNNQLKVTGKVEQTKIQPLEMTANLPLDVAAIAREGGLPDDTPLTAKVHLPRSSVNFIRQFVPDLEQLDGDVALDVDVTGTIGKPVLNGAGDITINVARATNATFPALTDFKARINFSDDSLTLQQFGGNLSGGTFSVSGGVRFPKLTEPVIDLAIKANSALAARNDTLMARVDADVKIEGPFDSATVTGTVWSTNSQFLKNIDLLPIGLPGRPPPQAPESRPDFSFPTPPLRDWKFDVAIKTKEPFRIRGNLAKGGAVADLHLTGTGLHPGIEGMVRLENVEATLPFSRLDVSYGYLSFDPGDSFNPKIELHGTSVIRDYIIHVYVYGTALAPEAVFSSEPPLPQEEIISLLATGTTREELTSNNNVLAGRAATLLVQQLYRKIFKKGGEAESNSIFDRLELDVGQTDPRTGQREATARFKVNDQFVLLGDLDVAGGFKGMVKYLIRFR